MINRLEQQRELETKREKLEQEYKAAKTTAESLSNKVDELAAKAKGDIQVKKQAFSDKYSELMRNTLATFRMASLDENYMPVINGGEYSSVLCDFIIA